MTDSNKSGGTGCGWLLLLVAAVTMTGGLGVGLGFAGGDLGMIVMFFVLALIALLLAETQGR